MNDRDKAIRERRQGKYVETPHEEVQVNEVVSRYKTQSKRYYHYYRDCNFNKKPLLTFFKWRSTLNAIFEEIGNQMIESQSGVFMENWGYFGIIKYPKVPDNLYKTLDDSALKMYDGGVIYKPAFFPIRKDRKLESWTFNNSFARTIEKRIYDKVYKGFKYTFSYSVLKALYGHKGR